MFSYFVGIDQTGAVNRSGKLKKMWVSILGNKTKSTYTNLQIESLTKTSLNSLFDNLNIKITNNDRILVCVDSAIGLPFQYKVRPERLVETAKNFSYKNKTHGSYVADKFFNSFRRNKKIKIDKRLIDIKLNAQSVFLMKPFQRNIACGSYRILKDLAIEKKWYALWPFENIKNYNFVICEGYPSYYWKSLFGQAKRNLDFFNNKNLEFKTLDQADSYVLAYAAKKYQSAIYKTKLNSKSKLEGWVLGCENEE